MTVTPPTTDTEPATGLDPRDSMTVWEIARNVVDEFPAIPKDIRPTVMSEIAGALGHERLAAERASGGLDVERLMLRELANAVLAEGSARRRISASLGHMAQSAIRYLDRRARLATPQPGEPTDG